MPKLFPCHTSSSVVMLHMPVEKLPLRLGSSGSMFPFENCQAADDHIENTNFLLQYLLSKTQDVTPELDKSRLHIKLLHG